jgi:hypothetical protein
VALGELGIGAVVPRAPGDDPGPKRALEHGYVEALDRGDAIHVRVDQVGQPPQMNGTASGSELSPRGECPGGGFYRELDLRLTAARDLGDQLLVDRRAVLEALGRCDAFSADEVIGRDGDTGDHGGAHAANSVALASTTAFPPSTAKTLPVTKDAFGDASQATASAISSGTPGRRSGTRAETLS